MPPLTAIGLWLLLFAPGIPYAVFLWQYRRGRGTGDERPDDSPDDEPLGCARGCLIALSSYWLFVALLFSPWIFFYLGGSGGPLAAYFGFLTGCAGAVGLILWVLNRD
jgi:hypothetical protein